MSKASKTNVGARQAEKNKVQLCRNCKNPVNVVMTLSPTGRKRMLRKCCGEKVGV
jgi:hypothetical protein